MLLASLETLANLADEDLKAEVSPIVVVRNKIISSKGLYYYLEKVHLGNEIKIQIIFSPPKRGENFLLHLKGFIYLLFYRMSQLCLELQLFEYYCLLHDVQIGELQNQGLVLHNRPLLYVHALHLYYS